jgi:signal recognition particle GTPase
MSRIAKGAGTNLAEVETLLKQFDKLRKMMAGLRRGGDRPSFSLN